MSVKYRMEHGLPYDFYTVDSPTRISSHDNIFCAVSLPVFTFPWIYSLNYSEWSDSLFKKHRTAIIRLSYHDRTQKKWNPCAHLNNPIGIHVESLEDMRIWRRDMKYMYLWSIKLQAEDELKIKSQAGRLIQYAHEHDSFATPEIHPFKFMDY